MENQKSFQEISVELLYAKHQTMNLKIEAMAEEIGISVSKANKMFCTHGENFILEKKLLPKWKKVGITRLWALKEIIVWINCYE